MISIYKKINDQFMELDQLEEGAWINVVDPSNEEVRLLSDTLNIHAEQIESILDEEERARIEVYPNYTLIIVDVPYMNKENNNRIYQTIPIAIILLDYSIVTVCLRELPLFKDLIDGKVNEFYTDKRTRFILQILYRNASYYLDYLREIEKRSDQIECSLQKSMKNKELLQLLALEKSLVYFTVSLKSADAVLEKMLRLDAIKQYPSDERLLEDVIIEHRQAIEMSAIYSGVLNGMVNASASIISNNLNILMKTLTSITLIISIPTMIGSFYGMNVVLPLQDHPYAFIIILFLSITISFLLAFYMIRKKMF
jgi:magnesium transporter